MIDDGTVLFMNFRADRPELIIILVDDDFDGFAETFGLCWVIS